MGALCCGLTLYIVLRMEVLDHEAYPFHLTGSILTYLPWLFWQVIVANVDLALRILNPRLPIDPVLTWVAAGQRGDLETVIHANSITLTPGTVSTAVEHRHIQVHCLSRHHLEELESGAMDARVRALEDTEQ